MKTYTLTILFGMLGLSACGGGEPEAAPFAAALGNCREYVGIAPVPAAAIAAPAIASLPAVQSGGKASFKIRASNCGQLSIDGGPPQPTITLQVGVSAVVPVGSDVPPPGFSAQFAFITNNAELAERLRRWGMAVEHDPALSFVYTPEGTGGGRFEAGAQSVQLGAFSLAGKVTPSSAATPPIVVPFVAEWSGAARDGGVVTMRTSFPAIAIGVTPGAALPSVTVTAAPGSTLAAWMDGDSLGFSLSGRFNDCASASMMVAPRAK